MMVYKCQKLCKTELTDMLRSWCFVDKKKIQLNKARSSVCPVTVSSATMRTEGVRPQVSNYLIPRNAQMPPGFLKC